MKRMVQEVLMGLCVIAVLAVIAPEVAQCEEDSEQQVTIDQVPAVVKAAIEKETAGGQVKELVKEVEDGETIYEAMFAKDGQLFEVEISPEGKVLEREQCDAEDEEDDDAEDEDEVMVKFADAPEVVQKTMKREGAGSVTELEKEIEKGKTVYEAEIKIDGKPYEVEVLEDGTLLLKVLDMDDDDDDDDDDHDGEHHDHGDDDDD